MEPTQEFPSTESPHKRPRAIPTPRTSPLWLTVRALLVAMALALLFIVQNLRRAQVTYFTAHCAAPLALNLLLAAVLNDLVVAMVAALRIAQLSSRTSKSCRLEAKSLSPRAEPADPSDC